eukprot:TRINITY_DN7409_c0_g1_i1.p2 TRINITY_DN7409_c0_g1~~TRINITY_DN7409_c0_g1_i1.p2  ORF type:complete len:178 (+),score=60.29 TRINITY_DN7409_c0_g1_i1:116-649(+)
MVECTILLLGDEACGKTSIQRRYTEDDFSSSKVQTIGFDYKMKNVPVRGRDVKVMVWEAPASEPVSNLKRKMGNVDACVIVFDCTRQGTFESATTHWLEAARACCPEDARMLLAANKIDLQQRVVSSDIARDVAASLQLEYVEMSALSGEGVAQCLDGVAVVANPPPERTRRGCACA